MMGWVSIEAALATQQVAAFTWTLQGAVTLRKVREWLRRKAPLSWHRVQSLDVANCGTFSRCEETHDNVLEELISWTTSGLSFGARKHY